MRGGTIVCGVTATPEGQSAVDHARALGSRLGLRLVLVHVTDRHRQDDAEQMLAAISRRIGNGAEQRVMLGERATALAQVAAEEGADLIVVGARRAGRKLRCTLARELEAETPVPVLLAPPSTRRRSGRRLSAVAAETR
jgi:nucleotide-binding universal stress UspA family protein